jgi:hypothetical protein
MKFLESLLLSLERVALGNLTGARGGVQLAQLGVIAIHDFSFAGEEVRLALKVFVDLRIFAKLLPRHFGGGEKSNQG